MTARRPPASPGPDRLWVVRHGESAGNVARDRAEAQRLERIELTSRDVDVPLSPAGEEQARALGRELARSPSRRRWSGPRRTCARVRRRTSVAAAGLDLPVVVDERLREREFGVLDGLTRRGIVALHPQEAERRAQIGKFYHRPPGGESWSDVLLRLRAALSDLAVQEQGERVLLVAHQVVVLLVRYVLERLTEPEVLEIDRAAEVANCSVTTYERRDGRPVLVAYNDVRHLERGSAEVTAEPDVSRAAR